jgi:hypothetical protein
MISGVVKVPTRFAKSITRVQRLDIRNSQVHVVTEIMAAKVINSGKPVWCVAKTTSLAIYFSMGFVLCSYAKNYNPKTGYRPKTMALGPEGEEVLKYTAERAADLYCVLSTRDRRSLAYRYAVHYKLKCIRTERKT